MKKPRTKKKIKKPAKRRKIKVKPKKKKKARRKLKMAKVIKAKKSVSDATFHKTKVRVIGIGGGGGSIVSEIVSRVKRADFVVANTDSRALKGIRRVKRFQFGQDLTHGLGTGMNTEVGETAALNEKEKIKKLFEGQDLCIIISSLGGGTGSGSTPIFAKISKSLKCLTYGIFTLPFEFEGEKKMEIAKESLLKIKPHLNAFSVIPNERIFRIIDKDTPLKDALSAINEKLVENLEGLIGMIYLPGLINIDFADLKTVLSGRGKLAYLNTIEIEDLQKEEAVKKVTSTPFYPYTIKGARGILYNIVGGKALQLSEVSRISRIISDSVNKNAKIIFGINQSPKYQNKIRITLLATGCGGKGVLLKPVTSLESSLSIIEKSKPPSVKITPVTVQKPKRKTRIMLRRQVRKPKSKSQPTVDQPKVDKSKPKSKLKTELKPKKKIFSKPKKKLKIRISVKKKKVSPLQPMAGQPRAAIKKKLKKKKILRRNLASNSKAGLNESIRRQFEMPDGKVRRTGLQLKKVVEDEEKELLEQEKIWETPAILRRKNNR